MGNVAPDEVPYWINAANAVLVPSQDEGFGLSVIEALACDVPALGTPVGIHPVALGGIDGAHCLEWDAGAWRETLAPILADPDPRVDGAARAELFSADRMAARVVAAWRDIARA
jgi:glycosyltransferase involved in cell wall biosynthesis